MKINRKLIDGITKRLDIVSAAGRSTVEQIMINAPQSYDFDEVFAYVTGNYLPIVEACADDAATIGAAAYDAYRELEIGEALDAMPYSAYNSRQTASDVGKFVSNACMMEDMSLLVDNLGRKIDTEVMRSYSNTSFQNGKGDPSHPRYARVPTGTNPCAFCRALAGHGFFYTSENAAGAGANKFHDYCRCQIVPQFSAEAKKLEVAGYNPQVYVEEWRETRTQFGKYRSRNTTPTGRPSAAMPKISQPLLTETPEAADLPPKAYGGDWDQAEDMDRFLKTMFENGEYVGTCSEFYTDKDGRKVPTRGLFQRSAGQIENVLEKTGNVSSAVGRYHTADGAYVRINPLDGKGVSDANVTAFRYALIECDTITPEQQYGFVKALNLPTKAITTSGRKSLHAVVKVDAANLDEYKERVALLHAECRAAGFDVDASTKNPSRYMRIPGVKRGTGRQVLVSTEEGAASWESWRKWCEQKRGRET